MSTAIAQRYARALINLATREDALEAVRTGLDDFADAVAGSDQLRDMFLAARVPQASKEAVVADLLQRLNSPKLVSNFVRFIGAKRRLLHIEAIRQAFHRLADDRMGRAVAEVTVASDLEAGQLDDLRKRLEALTGKEVTLDVKTDPAILGGAIARIDSTVWDGSLRASLDSIRKSIIGG